MDGPRIPTHGELASILEHRLGVNRIELGALQDEKTWLDTLFQDLATTDPQDGDALCNLKNLLTKGG